MKHKSLKSPADTFDLQFPEGKTFDVVGLGANSVDHLCVVPRYPQFDSKTEILQYERLAGGQVATAMAFLSRIGLKVKYVGKVGEDDLGQFSLQSLRLESIDIDSVLMEPGARNQSAIIIIDRTNGERTILWQRDRALDFRKFELRRESVCAGRFMHTDGCDYEAALQAAAWCRQEGVPVCIDLDALTPNCSALITDVDFLIVSSNFPSDFTGIADPMEAFVELKSRINGFLVVTVGNRGAIAALGDQCLIFPALEVKAVDTTGAGDLFHGGFIYGLLRNWPLGKIMAFSNAAAGLSCGYMGARAGFRPLPEILNCIDRKPLEPKILGRQSWPLL
jgi:sulfofructose kinase